MADRLPLAVVIDEYPGTPGHTIVEVWCPHHCGKPSQRLTKRGSRIITGGTHLHGVAVGDYIGARVADCGGDQYEVARWA